MTRDTPTPPPRPDKVLRREEALRDNLQKRKAQQRARKYLDKTSNDKDDK